MYHCNFSTVGFFCWHHTKPEVLASVIEFHVYQMKIQLQLLPCLIRTKEQNYILNKDYVFYVTSIMIKQKTYQFKSKQKDHL